MASPFPNYVATEPRPRANGGASGTPADESVCDGTVDGVPAIRSYRATDHDQLRSDGRVSRTQRLVVTKVTRTLRRRLQIARAFAVDLMRSVLRWRCTRCGKDPRLPRSSRHHCGRFMKGTGTNTSANSTYPPTAATSRSMKGARSTSSPAKSVS